MEGWIKLHRKVLDNEILRDQTAWMIFCWLLLSVDRRTGKTTVGRFLTSKELKLKPTTFYQALKRLEKKYKMIVLVTRKMTIKFTEVEIINWFKYQSNDKDNDNPMTIRRQSNDNPMTHIQEVENKEIEKEEKIPNRLVLSKRQLITYAKEFQGLTTIEIKEQKEKCNAYMNMSSSNYTNPGLFFRGWLDRYAKEKRLKEAQKEEERRREDSMPVISEEERQRNLIRLKEARKTLIERRVMN